MKLRRFGLAVINSRERISEALILLHAWRREASRGRKKSEAGEVKASDLKSWTLFKALHLVSRWQKKIFWLSWGKVLEAAGLALHGGLFLRRLSVILILCKFATSVICQVRNSKSCDSDTESASVCFGVLCCVSASFPVQKHVFSAFSPRCFPYSYDGSYRSSNETSCRLTHT